MRGFKIKFRIFIQSFKTFDQLNNAGSNNKQPSRRSHIGFVIYHEFWRGHDTRAWCDHDGKPQQTKCNHISRISLHELYYKIRNRAQRNKRENTIRGEEAMRKHPIIFHADVEWPDKNPQIMENNFELGYKKMEWRYQLIGLSGNHISNIISRFHFKAK